MVTAKGEDPVEEVVVEEEEELEVWEVRAFQRCGPRLLAFFFFPPMPPPSDIMVASQGGWQGL